MSSFSGRLLQLMPAHVGAGLLPASKIWDGNNKRGEWRDVADKGRGGEGAGWMAARLRGLPWISCSCSPLHRLQEEGGRVWDLEELCLYLHGYAKALS